ncbi:MAG: hypothetical protein ABIS45_08520 [Burkholderiales bacterium]
MANTVTATITFRVADMHCAAASLRRLSLLAAAMPPALTVWLSKSYGAATSVALAYAAFALLVALPFAWALRVFAKAVHANALHAEQERDSGVTTVEPLLCRG